MKKRIQRVCVKIALVMPVIALLLTGCWDAREIKSLFFVTGIGIDIAEEGEQVALTLQAAKLKQDAADSGGNTKSEGEAVMILESQSSTVLAGMMEIDRNNDHKLMLHHNQVVLFGKELCRQGVREHMDLFLRDRQSRLDMPVAVVDAQAKEALTAKIPQEPVSGMFFSGMFGDMSEISDEYRVRLIDFISRLISQSCAPVLPIVQVVEKEDTNQIVLTGMAVFTGPKMVGELNMEQTRGYVWAMGNVRRDAIVVGDESGTAVLRIDHLQSQNKMKQVEGDKVHASLSIEGSLTIGEMHEFSNYTPAELIPHLEKLAQEKILGQVRETFELAQGMKADIFRFGKEIYRMNPDKWEGIKDRWNEVFSQMELDIEVSVRIPATGQIVQTLEMEEKMR